MRRPAGRRACQQTPTAFSRSRSHQPLGGSFGRPHSHNQCGRTLGAGQPSPCAVQGALIPAGLGHVLGVLDRCGVEAARQRLFGQDGDHLRAALQRLVNGATVGDLQQPAALFRGEVAVQHDLPGEPVRGLQAAAAVLQALPAGAAAVIEGWALDGFADCLAREAWRLRLLALVHHPLAVETGLTPEESRRFAALEARLLPLTRGVLCPSPPSAAAVIAYGVPVGLGVGVGAGVGDGAGVGVGVVTSTGGGVK